MSLGNFPKFSWKNSKLSVLPESWHTWYLGGVYSKSTLRFLQFRPQNPFLGKFGLKKSKLSILPENWNTEYGEDADSYSNINFLNFQAKSIFRQSWAKKVEFYKIFWRCGCKDPEEGLGAIKINNCLKCLLLLYFYHS